MKISKKISQKMAMMLNETAWIPEKEIPIYQYCLDYFIETLIYITIFLIISIILKRLDVCLIFLGASYATRIICGGYHASTQARCTFFTFFIYFFVILYAKSIAAYFTWQWCIVFSIALLIIILFAPVDTPKRRMSPEKQKSLRTKSRLFCCILTLVYLIFYFQHLQLLYGTFSFCVIIASCSILLGYLQNRYLERNTI